MERIPILSFHSLDESDSVISTRPEQFARQMERLAQRGYQAITVAELIAGWAGERPGPPKLAVITFDDGFRNVRTVAAPILARLGFRATIFITVNYCGGLNDWPTQPATVPRLPLLDWDEVRALSRQGMEIGAHTLTHPPLTQISEAQAEEEILQAKQVIERETQRPVHSFAYPYGAFDERIRRLVSAHYQAACGTRLGFTSRRSDPYALERIDAYYLRSDFPAAHLGSAWMESYLRIRQWIRDRRGTGRYYRL